MTWTRAIHLTHWADTQDARHQLPNLLRKLVRATIPKEHVKTVNFPSAEQVQRPGLDGLVDVTLGNQFVPEGISAWEAGVNKNKKGKADSDLEKRTDKTPPEEQQNQSYVFVTLRSWETKDEWAEEKSESDWKNVNVLDANDLEHWLELAPAVDIWLSTLMGRRPPGVVDIVRHWRALANIAAHPLQPALFLTSRDSAIESVKRFLQQPASSAFLRSEGWDEGVDFIAALIASGDANLGDLDRLLVVTEIEAWRHLAGSLEPLVLVASSSLILSATDVADAVINGHHVLVTGANATTQATEIELPRQDHYELYKVLEECGYEEARAHSYASGCCGSSTVLKRLITTRPDRVFPKWSQDEFRTRLAPFSLLGGWAHVDPEPPPDGDPLGLIPPPPLDLWCFEQFGLSRAEVEEAIARWGTGEEPLFVQFGNSVLVGSREDAWYLLGGSLSGQQLKVFQDMAILILDEDNPALKLDPDKRWMANLYGKVTSLSGELRRSVVESLALMSCYPTAIAPSSTVDFQATVCTVLENILPENAPWERWASLGSNLAILAECNPELLLDRIEADLASNSPHLLRLFENSSSGMFGPRLHCDLLWALECLAWSPDYIGRVSRILARLAARTTDLQSGNNPMSSLEELFLLWLPHTSASIDDRITAIESIVNNEPEVGWQLIAKLLPSALSGSCSGTHTPRWRPWAHGWTRHMASRQTASYESQFGEMILRLAGKDTKHWARIVDGMLRLGGSFTDRTIGRLEEIASVTCDSSNECFELWDALRYITYHHARSPGAPWSFPQATLNRLADIRDRIKPQDPVLQNCQLFQHHIQLPDVDELDCEEYDRIVARRRCEALEAIVAAKGIDGVYELMARSEDYQAIGMALGEHTMVQPTDLTIPESLVAGDESRRICALSYCSSRFWKEGWTFVEPFPVREWTAEQVATLATCFRFQRATWVWVAEVSHEAEALYWERCRPYLREPTIEDVDYAVEKLLAVGRTFAAADFVHRCSRKEFSVDDGRVLDLLERGLSRQTAEDAQRNDCYAIQQLISQLQSSHQIDRSRLARVEWGYLPILDRFAQVKPTTLFQALCDEPEFFYHLLELQYRAEDEDPGENRPSEHEQSVARLAYDLFEQFRLIPGTREHGTIDAQTCNTWIDQVRRLADDGKRPGVCDHRIGAILSNCPMTDPLDHNSHVVLEAMERLGSEDVFDGFHIGTLNSRGVTARMPTTGGEPERILVEKYRAIATNCRDQYPATAKMFEAIARSYEENAKTHDESARRRKLGR